MNELINLIFELQYFKDGILTLTVLDIKLEALVTVLKMESIVFFLVLTNWMDWRALVYVYCWKN